MTLENYTWIMEQSANKGLFQVALGGHGDPNKHEDFAHILEITRRYGIVPNYTTSGYELSAGEIALTKKYCGAVAVSMYNKPYTWNAIDRFIKAGMKTNIHWVIGKDSIDHAIEFLTSFAAGKFRKDVFIGFIHQVNALVFLLYKPVGCGKAENVLDPIADADKIAEFFDAVYKAGEFIKIGFDSCTVPALISGGRLSAQEKQYLDTCEGGRYSAYVTPDMYITPCSFSRCSTYHVEIGTFGSSIQDAWDSASFGRFRLKMLNPQLESCSKCSDWKECRGGCPLMKEIVPCKLKQKELRKDEI